MNTLPSFYHQKHPDKPTPPDAYEALDTINDPTKYTPSEALVKAVNMAILLGKPLLITGEPGTGKTLLATSLSWQLYGKGVDPYVFTAKTTSKARDLFYTYDAIQHFHDSNINKTKNPVDTNPAKPMRPIEGSKLPQAEQDKEDFKVYIDPVYRKYIHLAALGKAIIKGREDQKRYVVLIDELDKAPRDFPNDLLMEIEQMVFRIEENNQDFEGDKAYPPIVIITSNSERLLPEPFLRRCVYFHIDFPSKKGLKIILHNRLSSDEYTPPLLANDQALEETLKFFFAIREDIQAKKPPATAEFLSWMEFLVRQGFNPDNMDVKDLSKLTAAEQDVLKLGASILIKHKSDFDQFYETFPILNPKSDQADG